MSKNRQRNVVIACAAIAAGGAVTLGVLISSEPPTQADPATVVSAATERASPRAANESTEAPPAAVTFSDETPRVSLTPPEETRLSEPATAGASSESAYPVDPEDQPRAFMVADFRNPETLPPGVRAKGVELTEDGYTLPDLDSRQDGPTFGRIESPALELDFAFNAVAPMWQETLPDAGTNVLIEMAVSPDGQTWSPWHEFHSDGDSHGQVNEYLPDGTRNPSYDYTPGGLLAFGLDQYTHLKYRLTLYSESEAEPTLHAFRLYYQDSTLGIGRIADPFPAIQQASTAGGTLSAAGHGHPHDHDHDHHDHHHH